MDDLARIRAVVERVKEKSPELRWKDLCQEALREIAAILDECHAQ